MAVYAIGDLQGCRLPFERLLGHLSFDPMQDQLWLAGDLVNRGPDSLGVLRRVHALQRRQLVLGNHDIYFLARAANLVPAKERDTLGPLLTAPDCALLADWLRQQPVFHHDAALGWSLVHAGLHPDWDTAEALNHADHLHRALRAPDWREFLAMIWSRPTPRRWEDCASEEDRQRFRLGIFTRTRLVSEDGVFHWPSDAPDGPSPYRPWHELYLQRHPQTRIVCGHWATQGLVRTPNLLALDSGCVWGKALSAARLDAKEDVKPVWQVECGRE